MDIKTHPLRDLTGVKKGTMTVLYQTNDSFAAATHKRTVRWMAQCDCGVKKIVRTHEVTNAKVDPHCVECGPKSRRRKAAKPTLSPMTFFNAPPPRS